MLGKLIKYDLKWINKRMVVYFVITLILSIFTRMISLLDKSFINNILYLILRGTTISLMVTTLINTLIHSWVRLRNNFYKDESYLTHTLPVTKNDLFNSKVISTIISIFISILVVLICFIIAFLNKDIIDIINSFLNSKLNIKLAILIIALVLLEIIFMALCGIVGIIKGYSFNNNNLLKAFIISIGCYFVFQLILFCIIYLVSMNNDELSLLFIGEKINNMKSIKDLMKMVVFMYACVNFSIYYYSKKVFLDGVNIE